MCGITGIINLNGSPVAVEQLQRMTDSLAHRGPDGAGIFTDGNVGLGHRRLAIIDLSEAGRQPMSTEDGRLTLTYNGEIYNFRELRRELEAAGHRFRSQTDSEVVLNAFAEWGPKCILRFNGMFAFAVWDRLKKQLFLARDRYGIKPLYYTWQKNTFLFASEHKAFLHHESFARKIDLEALLEYFTFQNIFTDRTLLQDVRLFPPGCWALLPPDTAESRTLHHTQYWDFDFREPEHPGREIEYLEELDRLFQQAVNRQLVSDVPVGAYLSGGMDSGAITAVAAKSLPWMSTFTCGFDLHSASGLELGFDERETAEHLSYLFKTEHYEMVLKAGDMERVLPKLVWHLEEPRVGQSYPNYYIAKLASKFVKVVLAGTGGDELFGGYPWRYYRAVANTDFEEYIDKYYLYWQRLIPNRLIKKVFRPVWPEVQHVWTRDIFRDVFRHHADKLYSPEDYVNHSLYFEAKTFLQGLLVVEDKLAMAHGLESRVPFLDNDLVDFAMRVPVSLKLGNLAEVIRLNENEPGPKVKKFYQKTRDGKLLLRRLSAGYGIDEKISNGIKQGFSAPDASWFKGESIEYVRNVIFNRNAALYSFFDFQAVTTLANEHLNAIKNRRLFIWSLLNFEKWCHAFLA